MIKWKKFSGSLFCRSMRLSGIFALAFMLGANTILWSKETPEKDVNESVNLVSNGDFTADPPLKDWTAIGDVSSDGKCDQKLIFGKGRGHDGGDCLILECSSFISGHAMLAQYGKVKLEKGKCYRLSFYAKGEDIKSCQVRVNIRDLSTGKIIDPKKIIRLAEDRVWKTYDFYFKAEVDISDSPRSRLQFWFTETGSFFIDDIRLVEVSSLPEADENVRFADIIENINSKNLIFNSSFECGKDGWGSIGAPAGYDNFNLMELYGEIDEDAAFDGKWSLKIAIDPEKMPVLYWDYPIPAKHKKQYSPLAVNKGWIQVEPGMKYTLSAYLKADRDNIPASLAVYERNPLDKISNYFTFRLNEKIKLTAKWERYVFTVKPRKRFLFIGVGPDFEESEVKKSVVWIDAVQMEKNSSETEYEPREALEIGVPDKKPGNVFDVKNDVVFDVLIRNSDKNAAELELKIKVTDFWDKVIFETKKNLQIQAESGILEPLKLALDGKKGFFRLHLEREYDGRTINRSYRFAVIEPYGFVESIFILNHAFPQTVANKLTVKAGVSSAREWALSWQLIEPEQGKFTFEEADIQVNRVWNDGMRGNVYLLPPKPSTTWSSEAGPEVVKEREKTVYAPKDPKLLMDYIKKTVIRYRDKIKFWEFFNEPLYCSGYSIPAAYGYKTEDYFNLLKMAHKTMKEADPECRIVGGIASNPLSDFNVELIKMGGLKYLDILNVHIYPGARAPETYINEMQELCRLMKEHGGIRPIWNTEWGYYDSEDHLIAPLEYNPSGIVRFSDEKSTTEYSIRFFIIMLANGKERFALHWGGGFTENLSKTDSSSLFSEGIHPHRLYPAISALANIMGPNPKFIKQVKFESENIYCYLFDCNGKITLAVWNPEYEKENYEITASNNEVRVLDIMGNAIPDKKIRITSLPLYLTSEKLSADELSTAVKIVKGE